jgi:hypothetical protein
MASHNKPGRFRKLRDLLSSTTRRVMAFVVAVGAVAGAISGVKALLPPSPGPIPTPETLVARFGSVSAYPEISLEQYDASAGSGGVVKGSPKPAKTSAVTYLLAADTMIAATGSTAGLQATSGTSASASTKTLSIPAAPTGRTSPPPTTLAIEKLRETSTERKYPIRSGGKIPTTTPAIPYPQQRSVPTAARVASPSRQSFHHVAGALVTEGAGAPKSKVAAVLDALSSADTSESEVSSANPEGTESTTTTESEAPGSGTSSQPVLPALSKACLSSCGENQEIENALTYDPNPVKAAEAVAALFNDSRGEIVDKRLYPIGAMVSYTLELDGFAHSKETLEWSLLAAASGRALPRRWWRDVIVAHIEPTVNHESISGTFWVPVPPKRSDYVVHLVLLNADGVAYASSDSRPNFH